MCPERVILLLDKRQIELVGVQLAVLASKNVAGAVSSRFQAIRNKKSLEEACNSYEEIINELIAERSQIIAIAQAYETELKRYTLGDEDIEYLQGTASAALDVVASFSPSTNLESFESLKSLISMDTLKAMRLLGFDHKKAIGDPLIEACARAITNGLGGGVKKGPGMASRQNVSDGKRR